MSRERPVMIVDDDADLAELLAQLVCAEGYPVLIARNGREALDRLRALDELPALILLDLMMPVMDGWSFRQAQLADPRLRDIPVVVLTADARAQSHSAARHVEFPEMLTKPVEFERLLERVRHYEQPSLHAE